MFPIRADEEKLGGIIHKAMFERLLVCDFAVADLTTSNANVMYELGVRHAARPRTTLTIYAESTPLPFDVRLLRTQPYSLGAENEFPDSSAATLRSAVAEHLRQLTARAETEEVSDSPLFQLVAGWKPELLSRQAAESFQIEVKANEAVKERLRLIRSASEDLGQRARLCSTRRHHCGDFRRGDGRRRRPDGADARAPVARRVVRHDRGLRGHA